MSSAILLAAGSSSRLGRPKQSLRLANETLLERAVRIARLAGLSPIFIIVSPELAASFDHGTPSALNLDAPSMRSLFATGWDHATKPPEDTQASAASGSRIELLINHHADEGIASSIRLGTHAALAANAAGTVILACDQIAVTPEHLRALTAQPAELRASCYLERTGIPAYFPRSFFTRLLALTGDTGARDLLRGAMAVPLTDGDLDIDTPDDLARARQLYPDLS